MSRAGTNGMTKILSFLRGYFAKDGDVIKTVNDQHADSNGNLDLRVVPAAQQLVTDDGKTEIGTFIDRTTGGEDSIGDGKVDVMQIRGNSTHTGIVHESITMTVQMTTRQEGQEGISAVIDEDAFKEAVSISGTTTLTYTTAWSTDPATYGVTVTGTPLAGDTITIVYVKADRGTITVATPSAFRETGWNLYNHSLGYARVKKYASSALFAIAGSYTALQFSETLTGEKTDVGVSSGYFTIAKDGYIWVTGGNNTNTEIYMCWSDWIDGHIGIAWEAYREDLLDLSDIMTACFPYGLMAVGGVYDEINLTDQKVISRVQRLAYTDEAAEEAAASGRKWDADTDYIYIERATAIETDLESILDEYDSSETYAVGTLCWYGTSAWRCTTAIGVAEAWNANHWTEAWRMTANDHGLEIFDDTTVAATIMILYGENLVDKIRRDLPAGIAANAQDIANIATVVTGTTNNCGHTISSGEYFIANGAKYQASATIGTGVTWADKATSVSDHDLINALNSKIANLMTRVSSSGTITTSTSFAYTGKSITIPGNSWYMISGLGQMNNNTPTGIALYTKSTLYQDDGTLLGITENANRGGMTVSCCGYASSEFTVYLFAKYNAAGNNNVVLTGGYFRQTY